MPNEFTLARAFLDVLLKTQHLPAGDLAAYQGRLLAQLYAHALKEVPFYEGRAAPDDAVDAASPQWLRLPFVTRADLAADPAALRARNLPEGHGEVATVESGGSTGRPVTVDLSAIESMARVVATYRMFVAWGMDGGRDLFMIRKPQAGSGRSDQIAFRRWYMPWLPEEELGERIHLDIFTPVDAQLKLLAERAPAYVNTLPSNILRLALAQRRAGEVLPLPIVISVAEYLAPEVKALAEEVFGCRVINILSSSEGGVIAIECPVSGMLHIQSEMVLAEIITEAGEPAREGETGELVVTALYNYANPLIRYKSGDYVVKGGACGCGSTLPTIAAILGRREHMFAFPNGRRALPEIDRVRITTLLGHEAWQFVQVAADAAEFHSAGGPADERAWPEIAAHLDAATGGVFAITAKPVDALPLTSGGKRHFCVNRAPPDPGQQRPR